MWKAPDVKKNTREIAAEILDITKDYMMRAIHESIYCVPTITIKP